LFGLASFKPQLGVLIPIALISAKLWRNLVAAGMTLLMLVGASSILLGWSLWPIWLAKVLSHLTYGLGVKTNYNPTIMGNLISLGVAPRLADILQLCAAAVVAIMIWLCFRRGATALATAALLAGTFLATPYAFIYDMPILTNAILVVKYQMDRPLSVSTNVVLLLTLMLPGIITEVPQFGIMRNIPLLLFFGVTMWHVFGRREIR
jgi:hypothetical protein